MIQKAQNSDIWSLNVLYFVSLKKNPSKIIVLPPTFLNFSSFLSSVCLLPSSLFIPPSLSLPSKFASSHADLSLDRWSRAKSVYLHTGPNKTSRCPRSCSSPPITVMPKQGRQEQEKGKESTEERRGRLVLQGRKGGVCFLTQKRVLLHTLSEHQTWLPLVLSAFSHESVCHLHFISFCAFFKTPPPHINILKISFNYVLYGHCNCAETLLEITTSRVWE